MRNIQPITALRNTSELEAAVKEDGTVFITKNGYGDLVILSPEEYDKLTKGQETQPPGETTRVQGEEMAPAVPQDDPLGFVKVRSCSIPVSVADPEKNGEEIMKQCQEAALEGVKILVFPELSLTGYTCGDLFLTETLLNGVASALKEIAERTKRLDLFFVVGAPIKKGDSLYNAAIAISNGKILGVVPKTYLPNYGEFYEKRHFASGPKNIEEVSIGSFLNLPFGSKLIFVDANYRKLKIAIEICEDLWVAHTPSTDLSLAGADVILNLSASNEVVGKREYRRDLVKTASARLISAYVYSDAGEGESTTDLIFAGHNLIAENGKILAETHLFKMESATAEIDVEKILSERMKTTTFVNSRPDSFKVVFFSLSLERPATLSRHYPKNPFIPEGDKVDLERVKLILSMQAKGLEKRLLTVTQKRVVIGLSGGLDSTLALLVAVEAFKNLGYDLKGIFAITLPAFGTSSRTHDNAMNLAQSLGVSFEEVNLKESLLQHFKDLGHDPNDHNLTYENAQARERTQFLMDLSGDRSALMIGTGDLSELCLGWTTYNGDHMSMYGVNASIPKTLVRYLVEGYAILHPEASGPLNDIVLTPISPELLPTDKTGAIAQKTEDKVGPYELNDFFIYHFLRFGYSPEKIFFLAENAYRGVYDHDTIKKWLHEFFSRFFRNEFKRSCLPDGAKVGTVAISPRGDLRMPSDASARLYLEEIEKL